jgi:hypothetical protein
VQFPSNSQSFNRYSYALNNSLSYNDPSRYFVKRAFRKASRFVKRKPRSVLKRLPRKLARPR